MDLAHLADTYTAVRKSILANGRAIPITQMTARQRNSLRRGIELNRRTTTSHAPNRKGHRVLPVPRRSGYGKGPAHHRFGNTSFRRANRGVIEALEGDLGRASFKPQRPGQIRVNPEVDYTLPVVAGTRVFGGKGSRSATITPGIRGRKGIDDDIMRHEREHALPRRSAWRAAKVFNNPVKAGREEARADRFMPKLKRFGLNRGVSGYRRAEEERNRVQSMRRLIGKIPGPGKEMSDNIGALAGYKRSMEMRRSPRDSARFLDAYGGMRRRLEAVERGR